MSDPLGRHGRVLEALDGQIEIAHRTDASGWLAGVLPAYEGRRRILQRHAPEVGVDDLPYCFRCAGQWPCADWLDAASGLGTSDA
jgi:hypothetical protein